MKGFQVSKWFFICIFNVDFKVQERHNITYAAALWSFELDVHVTPKSKVQNERRARKISFLYEFHSFVDFSHVDLLKPGGFAARIVTKEERIELSVGQIRTQETEINY